MAYVGKFAADGSMNVTVVTGSSYTGLYAADGSINVVTAPGGSYVGLYHPCGAIYVTPVTDTTFRNAYAPDGSLYVTNTSMPKKNQGQPVTVVSGILFGGTPLALDGSNIVNNASSSTAVIALTTTLGIGVIVVGSLANVAISTITASGLTFTLRSTVNAAGNISEVWTAPYTVNFSGNITVTYASATFNTANAFGVGGGKTSSSFDSGGPQTSTSAAPPITTTNANDFIYSITSGNGSTTVPGAGWSLLGGGVGFFYGAIYKIVSSTQVGLTPDYSGGAYIPSAGVTDAIKQGP